MNDRAAILIDGKALDPRFVSADATSTSGANVRIEVFLPSHVVLHELQECCDATLTGEKLCGFLATDAKDYRGRAAYLTIARACSGIQFEAQAGVPARWNWCECVEVSEGDGMVRFLGTARGI